MKNLSGIVMIVALAVGCAQKAKPDPRVGQLEADNRNQQQRVAELEKKIGELEATKKRLEKTVVELRGAQEVEKTGADAARTGERVQIAALRARVEELQKLVTRLQSARTAARRPARPLRKRPDPRAVYSVPVAGAPFSGSRHAKVTMVMAFEFA